MDSGVPDTRLSCEHIDMGHSAIHSSNSVLSAIIHGVPKYLLSMHEETASLTAIYSVFIEKDFPLFTGGRCLPPNASNSRARSLLQDAEE